MKSSLRRFTLAILLGMAMAAILAAFGWYALTPGERRNDAGATLVASDGEGAESDSEQATARRRDTAGNSMLADALLSVERRPHISALVRQQAHLNGLSMFGQGVYRQQGGGEQRHVKWEVQTQIGDERASLVQLVDDRFLWIDHRLPSKRRVERVDLWRLRRLTEGEAALPRVSPGQAAAAAPWHSFGGLPMLLQSLAQNFDFAAPRQLQLGTEPVYALHGQWKAHRLRELLGQPANEAHPELPSRLPLDVLVLLGSRDYFPYLIEYRAATPTRVVATVPSEEIFRLDERPLMRIEFYQVSLSTPIDPNEFVYTRPEDIDAVDATPRYVDRIQRYRSEQLAADSATTRQ